MYVHNRHGKRMRLDSLFDELNLSQPPATSNHNTKFEINPDFSKVPKNYDSYITDKIMGDYMHQYDKGLQVIRPYSAKIVVGMHLQRWILRLFNRFITKYNRSNNTRVPRFNSFFKLANVVALHQYNLSYADVISIVLDEGRLELLAVQTRLLKPKTSLEEIEEDSLTFNDIKYNYWDRISDLDDVDMDDADLIELVPEYQNHTVSLPQPQELPEIDMSVPPQ